MFEQTVYFKISSPNVMDFVLIEKILGIPPVKKIQLGTLSLLNKPSKCSIYSVLEKKIVDINLDYLIEMVVDELVDKEDIINNLKEKYNLETSLVIFISGKCYGLDFTIEQKIINFCHKTNSKIWFDMYFSDDLTDDEN